MNEIIHKNFKRFLAGIGAMVLCFSYTLPVFAFGSNWESSDLYKSVGYYQGATKSGNINNSNENWYLFLSVTDGETSNTYPSVGTVGVIAYTSYSFKDRANIVNGSLYLLFYSFESGWWCHGGYSTNNLTWTTRANLQISSTYTANGSNGSGTQVYYRRTTANELISNNSNMYNSQGNFINTWTAVFPNIPILYGINNHQDILAVISLDAPKSQWPWMYQSSSGGIHFSDGTELDDSNTAVYSNVYTVMDINNDNSISNEEVNYYNVTYDTNYDYSSINNNTDFDLESFLYYVALKLDAGENPSGSSGGGSQDTPSGSGGISVGDGSFTQSQTQSIEQNAVNVTVTNNNELTNENLNHINQIINNNTETTENTFQDAIANMNQFRAMAAAFAALAGVVLGWLPSFRRQSYIDLLTV